MIFNQPFNAAMVFLSVAALSAPLCACADESNPPLPSVARKWQPTALDEVRWTGGFWEDRFTRCAQTSIPAMWSIMESGRYKPFLGHFLIAAGRAEGEYHGAPWNDGDFYKFLEGVAAAWNVTREPRLADMLSRSIDAIGAAQRSDGYVHTPVLVRRRNGDESAEPFQDRADFEMYNMGHLITAACVHHEATGKDDFLAIARKTADFLMARFENPTPALARNSVCPSHYMAMVDLYRTTGDDSYLNFSRRLLDMRNLVVDGGDDNQDRIPFTAQREAVGHAVRANYLYAGAADVFIETGDPALWQSLDALWHNACEQKMYVTGACGALFDGASPYGAEDQAAITRVHQAYGRNYQLPNITAHNETCASIGNVLWNWRMFLASGESKHLDVVELALYNAVLAGVSLDGDDYFYVNPLRQVEPLPTPLRWSRVRTPFVTSYCCPPNVVRVLAQAHRYAYSTSADAISVNLYNDSEFNASLVAGNVQLRQTTSYPWQGRIRIDVTAAPAAVISIKLRIPQWAASGAVSVNGEPPRPTTPGGFHEIRRHWRIGDRVELSLPMPAVLLEANPLVEENRNQVAVKRGPLVYCLESTDLPPEIRVQDVALPRDSEFAAVHEADLLNGVTVLRGEALARPPRDWKGKLYQPADPSPARRIPVTLIPYYAWSNRGPSEMTVWLPRE